MTIVQALTPEQVAAARTLFREYERSLGIDLCFQGFEQELAGLPGAYAPPRAAAARARRRRAGRLRGAAPARRRRVRDEAPLRASRVPRPPCRAASRRAHPRRGA